jgi:hypothetical protein
MVSVVVSIHMRKMFVAVRKIFVNARHAEQNVRDGGRVGTSEPNSCSYEARLISVRSEVQLLAGPYVSKRWHHGRLGVVPFAISTCSSRLR